MITVSETYDDNIFLTKNDKVSDWITVVTPGIVLGLHQQHTDLLTERSERESFFGSLVCGWREVNRRGDVPAGSHWASLLAGFAGRSGQAVSANDALWTLRNERAHRMQTRTPDVAAEGDRLRRLIPMLEAMVTLLFGEGRFRLVRRVVDGAPELRVIALHGLHRDLHFEAERMGSEWEGLFRTTDVAVLVAGNGVPVYPPFAGLEADSPSAPPAGLIEFFPLMALLGIIALLIVIEQSLPAFLGLAALVGVVILGGIAAYAYIEWRNDYWVVTNKRIVHVDEMVFIRKKRDETPLPSVTQVQYERHGIAAAILDFGDLEVETFTGNIGMRDMPNPMRIKAEVQQEVEKVKARERPAERKDIRDDLEKRIIAKEIVEVAPPQPEKPPSLRPTITFGVFRYFFPKLVDIQGDSIIWRKHWI